MFWSKCSAWNLPPVLQLLCETWAAMVWDILTVVTFWSASVVVVSKHVWTCICGFTDLCCRSERKWIVRGHHNSACVLYDVTAACSIAHTLLTVQDAFWMRAASVQLPLQITPTWMSTPLSWAVNSPWHPSATDSRQARAQKETNTMLRSISHFSKSFVRRTRRCAQYRSPAHFAAARLDMLFVLSILCLSSPVLHPAKVF